MALRSLIRNGAMALAAAVALAVFASCDGWLNEEEGDCSVLYRLKFRYDKNLKWADAFANEVSSVRVYAFDPSGVLVWQQEERIDPATAGNYFMPLGLPAGDYTLLAWCGLDNGGADDESFTLPDTRVGITRLEELQCMLRRKRDDAGAYSDTRLHRLFHGLMEVTLPADDDGGAYDFTMPLTKDTNHIRLILNHLSGESLNKSDFTFRLDDDNGLLGYDNELLPDENINYRPWDIQYVEAGYASGASASEGSGSSSGGEGSESSGGGSGIQGLVADFTVGRLVETHRRGTALTVTSKEGKTVARIPVIDYALMGKKYYEEEYNYPMDEREFLDRLDECVMTLFLDEDRNWISCTIQILSWRVVVSNVELE